MFHRDISEKLCLMGISMLNSSRDSGSDPEWIWFIFATFVDNDLIQHPTKFWGYPVMFHVETSKQISLMGFSMLNSSHDSGSDPEWIWLIFGTFVDNGIMHPSTKYELDPTSSDDNVNFWSFGPC